ncbi:MAG: alpha/beta fold hydrolase [Sphingobacteriales bacterium]|jgi:pimeloyl-ACP methyl ester carboxylesterase|nr:alpha/beta fold hydrolase [Sphingobacteriales bacterium]MBP9142515.1 alpha/beta fold hydrolase [Chitinophagales bacterium]MDA0199443.1 alpha/beta fold hydrolase [Bacteroidota bacterium]MBK6890501.1 alpha/beta fold hydrolase [Sphingobacteriales bacterium]MBK7526448.1 alpha/beta fold hydrolase [Sphingobacteriales bacterium]
MNNNSKPRHYVFIPGSFHASWCWYKMQPLLNENGNTSEAIDLPAHGQDTTPINSVTLDSYVDAVCNVLAKYNKPVVLIGHSRAGIVISAVAERMPDKIDQLVYLCAFLIPNGEPMVATALSDSASLLVSNLIFNEPEGWHIPKNEIYKDAFYNDCSAEDVYLAGSLLTKEPNAPVGTPLSLSDSKFGKVKKVYIHTTLDNTITYQLQKKMVERTRVNQTFEINAGHSPFFSQPKQLAAILLSL